VKHDEDVLTEIPTGTGIKDWSLVVAEDSPLTARRNLSKKERESSAKLTVARRPRVRGERCVACCAAAPDVKSARLLNKVSKTVLLCRFLAFLSCCEVNLLMHFFHSCTKCTLFTEPTLLTLLLVASSVEVLRFV
jgi:hypothetical protein